MKKHFIFLALVSSQTFAQNDSIQLEEVLLTDPFLKNHYKSQSQIEISEQLIKENQPSLSQLMQFEAPIYIKENGLGMVSSPSFRGTTASQTAVLWNGININSSINGQIDFNTINPKTYNGILVKPGGGSVAYGTGAIGGSIHLMDQIKYDQKLNQQLDLAYGSFDSYNLNYQLHYAKNNVVSNIGYARYQSDNDYKIDNYQKINRNGKYYFNTIDANLGVKFNEHELRFFSQFNFGKREFSQTPTLYGNQDFRALGQWIWRKNRINSDFKLAYTREANQYYPTRETKNTQDLRVDNWIAKYYLNYVIDSTKTISAFAETSFNKGNGTNLAKSERNTFGFGLIYQHQLSNKINYETSIRQDFSSDYSIPFIYALGAIYKPTDLYQLRVNFSKNYRVPTFNDLFWETGGNPDLKAENALQFEIGNDFKTTNFFLQSNLFYNDIKDMIQWIPTNGSAYWKPINVNHVKTYGVEFIGTAQWQKFQFKTIYTYTQSINQATDKTLIYIPKNHFNFNIHFNQNNWNAFIQNRWVDEVFIQSDNQAKIPDYWTTNLGLGYRISENFGANLQVNNIFNHQYQSVENRWMPGVNYQLSIHIKL